MWLPDPHGYYGADHGACDYYYPPSEVVGYGLYPYHSYYMPQLPDLDTGYNNGSDGEFSYKVCMKIFYTLYVKYVTN